MFKMRSFLLKIKTVAHEFLAFENYKGRSMQIYCREIPEETTCQVTTPSPPRSARGHDHCTWSRRALHAQSLDQAQAHQAQKNDLLPTTHPGNRGVPVIHNTSFTVINVFITLTTASRAGSALLSTLLEGNWNTQPAQYTLQSLGVKLSGNLSVQGSSH